MSSFSKFCYDLQDKKLTFKLDDVMVNELATSVEELVSRICDETGKMQSLFKVTKILKVGSSYEGTKILEPNEFDYLIELGELSKYVYVIPSFRNVCRAGPGFFALGIKDEAVSALGFNLPKGPGGDHVLIPRVLFDEFYQSVSNVFFRWWENWQFKDMGRTDVIQTEDSRLEVERSGGVEGMDDDHQPNFTIYLKFTTLKDNCTLNVNVDITFYIPVESSILDCLKDQLNLIGVQKLLNQSQNAKEKQTHNSLLQEPEILYVRDQNLSNDAEVLYSRTETAKMVFDTEGISALKCILILPSKTHLKDCIFRDLGRIVQTSPCFQVSFTETEVQIMKSLSSSHRLCYRVLKFFSYGDRKAPPKTWSKIYRQDHIPQSMNSLNSYTLKSALFHHSAKCDGQNHFEQCFNEILSYLMSCTKDKHLPNFFLPRKNSLGKVRGVAIDATSLLEKIQDTVQRISTIPRDEYSFEDICNLVVSVASTLLYDEVEIISEQKRMQNKKL